MNISHACFHNYGFYEDRIDCTPAQIREHNCAWDEEMYATVHQPGFGAGLLPACTVPLCGSPPCPMQPRVGSAQCKTLRNLVHGLAPGDIASAFRGAEEGSVLADAQDSCAQVPNAHMCG